MFKIIKSKEYERLLRAKLDADYYKEEVDMYRKRSENASVKNFELAHSLNKKIKELEEEVERLNNLSVKSNHNEVTIQLSDDLITITPVVRWKDSTEQKLIEIGALPDGENTPYAIQIALMTMAYEGIQQIVESFYPPVSED